MIDAIRRARAGGAAFLALAGLLLVLNGIGAYRNCADLRPVHFGEVAPDFELPRIGASGLIDGRHLALSDFRGSVVIVDFWATWCGPCQSSMPIIEEVAKRYRERGLRVLSVNTEGPGAATEARVMIDRLAPSVDLVADTGVASALYNVTTIPYMLIVDRQGTVRWVHRGMGTSSGLRDDLEEVIDELL